MVEIFVPLGAFITFAVILGLITRLIAAGMLNRTIREALRTDPGSVPLLAERLDRHPPWGDALLGWVFLALAVGMALLGLTEEDQYDRNETLRGAIVPLVIGVTVIAYAWFAGRRTPQP